MNTVVKRICCFTNCPKQISQLASGLHQVTCSLVCFLLSNRKIWKFILEKRTMKVDNVISEHEDVMLRKRKRTKYTAHQLEMMERLFEENQYPDSLTQEELANNIGVTLERVSVWFQNRRSKFKRQSRANHMTWMRKQVFPNKPSEHSAYPFVSPQLPYIPDTCHVLSPPDVNQTARQDVGWDKLSTTPYHRQSPPTYEHIPSILDSQMTSDLGSPTFTSGNTPITMTTRKNPPAYSDLVPTYLPHPATPWYSPVYRGEGHQGFPPGFYDNYQSLHGNSPSSTDSSIIHQKPSETISQTVSALDNNWTQYSGQPLRCYSTYS